MRIKEVNKKKKVEKRIFFYLLFVLLTFIIIITWLWYLQIIQGNKFRDLSENNRIRIRRIQAPRGLIFDRKGRILVDNYPCFNLSIIPEDAKNTKKQ
jgi:penicillin-binding protein 2